MTATETLQPGLPGLEPLKATGHGGEFQVVRRDPDGRAVTWVATCEDHGAWTGPTYEAVEDEWRKHVYAETGTAPAPMGSKTGRWVP